MSKSALSKLRRRLAPLALRAAQRLNDGHLVSLLYPPTNEPATRWGYGRRPHARLTEIFHRFDDRFRQELETLAAYHDDLLAIEHDRGRPGEPQWRNSWQLGLDGASIYGYIRSRKPSLYLEIGSGMSTLFADRARRDGRLSTRIISIDPRPRVDVESVCDEVIRVPLEQADLTIFDRVQAGDMVFVDSSHQTFTNSDVVIFMLDVLPELPPGVLIGVHDILLPDDYLPVWQRYWFSEQYLVAAYLLAEGEWLHPVLACNYASAHPDLQKVFAPLWADPRMEGVDHRGFVLWLSIAERRESSR